jgi:hypothetical protein
MLLAKFCDVYALQHHAVFTYQAKNARESTDLFLFVREILTPNKLGVLATEYCSTKPVAWPT